MGTDARLQREQEFHDQAFAEGTREVAAHFYAVAQSLFDWYRERLVALAPGARILEYGCGQGGVAFDLAHRGATVLGIDLSPMGVKQATERAQAEGLADRLEFRVMDAEHLDLPDASFDVVCGSGIIHHLDIERAYAEIARVLKPDGTGLFTEPLGHNPAINAYRNRTPHLRTADEHPLLLSDLQLAKRWFDEVETHYTTLTALAAIPLVGRRGFDRIVTELDVLDRLLFRSFPRLRRYAWLVGVTLRRPRLD